MQGAVERELILQSSGKGTIVTVNGTYSVTSMYNASQAACGDLGIAILPERLTRNAYMGERLVRVLTDWHCPLVTVFGDCSAERAEKA